MYGCCAAVNGCFCFPLSYFCRGILLASIPLLLVMSAEPSFQIHRSAARRVAEKHKAGQGVESLRFGAELKLHNGALIAERESSLVSCCLTANPASYKDGREYLRCEKVLSEAAKALIRRKAQAGAYEKREGSLEPPFMAPSDDAEEYSIVRGSPLSNCNADSL
jgi:hypothetical protein